MTATGDDPILDRYRSHAATLGSRFQELSSEEIYAPVADFLPVASARVLDIGAGSGRDALWLAVKGHRVTAVEPVEELSQQAAGQTGAGSVEWITDTLPDLASLSGRYNAFDLILLAGVWHHVPHSQRPVALRRFTRLLGPDGHIILSLRHGPGEDGRTIFSSDPEQTISEAAAVGLTLLKAVAAPSVQSGNRIAGVTWTWLVFQPSQEAPT